MARSQIAWGIDIGTTALKALKLQRQGDKIEVLAVEIIEHERFLTEADVDRREVVGQSLRKFMDRNQIRGETIFVSAPGSTSFARFVKLPPVEPRKIPEIVRFEAIQQIPFPLDQVNWDYHSFQNADSPDVEIGIFAIKKEIVSQLLADFTTAGLTVHGVQISPLAIYNAMVYEQSVKDKGTIVLDIGADHSDLIVMDQGRLWLRTINLGGNSFTEALAKSFKQQFKRAEHLKKTAATSKYARQIFQSMRPTFADLVAEIQRSIGYYNSSHRDSKIEQIIGMGNPFQLSNLQKYLQQYLGIDVHRIDNFTKVSGEAKLAASLGEHILGLPVAYGLALQGLDLATIDSNLLPVEIARKMVWNRKQPWFIATAALFLGAALITGGRYYADKAAYQASVHNPEMTMDSALIGKVSGWQSQYNDVSNTYQQNVNQVKRYTDLGAQRAIWPKIFTTIYDCLPQTESSSKPLSANWGVTIQSISSQYSSNLAPSGSAVPGAAGAGQAGFVLTINGYTTYRSPLVILEHFIDTLRGAAPRHTAVATTRSAASLAASALGRLPFYFVVPRNVLQIARVRGNGSGGESVGFRAWGTDIGPFGSEFLHEFTHKSSKTGAAGTTQSASQNNGMGGVANSQYNQMQMLLRGGSNFQPGGSANQGAGHLGLIDPDTGKSLANATAFHMTVLVYLRGAGGASDGVAIGGQ